MFTKSDERGIATLLPHIRFGKTRENSTVGQKVPAGRMRGHSSAPLAPLARPTLCATSSANIVCHWLCQCEPDHARADTTIGERGIATLLPHIRFGKTQENSTVGEKVPAGRMRGHSSAPLAPLALTTLCATGSANIVCHWLCQCEPDHARADTTSRTRLLPANLARRRHHRVSATPSVAAGSGFRSAMICNPSTITENAIAKYTYPLPTC
jgi:hypothetical protein